MNALFLKALIIDKDQGEGLQMSQLVKDLFNKVNVVHTLAEAVTDFQDVRPNVLLLNLNIHQRTENFELLEALQIPEEWNGLIFGYCESHEPQLLAHAIELGFHDLFVRPYDAAIIASKINKHTPSVKTRSQDLAQHPMRPALKAMVKLPFTLLSIDENGLSFKTANYMAKGSFLKFSHPLMQQIFGKESAEFMITKTWQGEDWNDHFFFAEPKVPGEEASAHLRRFILGQA